MKALLGMIVMLDGIITALWGRTFLRAVRRSVPDFFHPPIDAFLALPEWMLRGGAIIQARLGYLLVNGDSRWQSHTTTNHREIRQWVEDRGGKPATVKRTKTGQRPGVLRIDFPGYSGKDSLETISWEEFFEKFEAEELAFLYQEQTKKGSTSRFFKLVERA